MKAIFDSDILIDFLQGKASAKKEIHLFEERCISLISWIEVLCGAETTEETNQCRSFLMGFRVIPVTLNIAEQAVNLRKMYRIKIPDALIWATAKEEQAILVTRNSKDFPVQDPGIRIPYRS